MKSNEQAGLLFALGGFALLSVGDAVVKTMAGQWAPTAVAALRYSLGALWLGLLLTRQQGPAVLAPVMPAIQLLRGVSVAVATVGYFSAIYVMPLATATAITFTSPMITALLAAMFLREPASRSTVVASLIAFAGVLIVLRPNFAELGWAVLFPLASALGMSVLMICNRFVAGKGSALSMQFYVASMAAPVLITTALVAGQLGIPRFALDWPSWSVVAKAAFVSISASVAHWLVYMGTTRAGAATIAPMTYIQLLMATAFGYFLFGDHPDLTTMLGAAVIIGAGLYLWWAGRPVDPDTHV